MDNIFTLNDLIQPIISGNWQGKIRYDKEEKTDLQQKILEAKQYCDAISHQDKVVIKVSNTPDTIAALLAVWHLGGVVIPVKSDMADSALRNIIDDSGAHYVLDPETKTLCLALTPTNNSLPTFSYVTPPKLTGVDLAMIIYTSGSTGKPKGIMLTHSNVTTALRAIVEYLGITQDDKILLISPLSFDYGMYQLLFCLATSCELVLSSKAKNPIGITGLVKKQGVTVLPLIPALASSLFKYLERFGKTLSGVRLITSTGGVFPAHVAKGLAAHFEGADIIKMYGLTESKRVSYLPANYLHQKSDSVGIPMPGLDAKIFKEVEEPSGRVRLEEQAYGEIGQLYVRGSSVFQQYFNVESTAGAKIISGNYRDDNWLATGDLFSQDQDGFLYFKGRVKDLIKQNGFCIYPRDMEAIVYGHNNVEVCQVAGVKDDFDNEVAKLFVVLVENTLEDQLQFKSWLTKQIDSDYMFGEIQYLDQMPLSANGKVDVSQLTKAA